MKHNKINEMLFKEAKLDPIYLVKLSGPCKAGSRSYVTAEPADKKVEINKGALITHSGVILQESIKHLLTGVH